MSAPLLVVGCGSVGERHLRNLLTLGAGALIACDVEPARREAMARAYGVETVANLEEGLSRRPRAALICTPPASHISLALAAAEAGCHLFIEKPLALASNGIKELQRVVETQSLVALVACNMRFHPGIRQLKQWLDAGAAGRVLSAHVQFGHYLPNWRPSADYRRVYSAQREAGGGILFDAIHELDYIMWLLGEIAEVACLEGKVSDLEIDTEDTVVMLLRTRAGAMVTVHLDYTQRIKRRRCEIVGSEGTLIWESRGKTPESLRVERYSAGEGAWETRELNADANQPFVDEMAHFLRCLARAETPLQNLAAGAQAVAVTLAAANAARCRATLAV